jgi:transcriptional regulator with XRE-family HTH domain
MSQEDLAQKAAVSAMTIKRFEANDNIAGTVASLTKIQKALEQEGIIFIEGGPDGGPGVRLSK